MLKWIKNYGVVAVISVGLIGSFLLWGATRIVDAQTAELEKDLAISQIRVEAIQADVASLKASQQALATSQQELKANQQTLGAGTGTDV